MSYRLEAEYRSRKELLENNGGYLAYNEARVFLKNSKAIRKWIKDLGFPYTLLTKYGYLVSKEPGFRPHQGLRPH